MVQGGRCWPKARVNVKSLIMLMPTWGHKRLVWHPAAVLWPASVELYSNTVSISQYKYDSPPLHIRTSCIHISQSGDRPRHKVQCCTWIILICHQVSPGRERESLTRLFTSGPPSSPGEKGGVSVSVTQSLSHSQSW